MYASKVACSPCTFGRAVILGAAIGMHRRLWGRPADTSAVSPAAPVDRAGAPSRTWASAWRSLGQRPQSHCMRWSRLRGCRSREAGPPLWRVKDFLLQRSHEPLADDARPLTGPRLLVHLVWAQTR